MKEAGGGNESKGALLKVEVDVSEALGGADLEGFLGVCVWNLPTEADDPMHKAWKRAGFKYPRWPFLRADVSWEEKGDGSRSMELDYGALDATLDGCKGLGVVPLFSFSDMPEALAAKPVDKESEGPFHYGPADYGEWEEYVRRVVERVVAKGYTGGLYEVWNEPEDFNHYWMGRPGSEDTLTDYIDLYVATARGVLAADPTAKVGGPVCAHWDSVTVSQGAHSWGLPQFIRRLAEYRKEHPEENVPFDFVDWHDYSFATTLLSDGIDLVDSVLAEVGLREKLQYLITEWNRTLGGEVTPQDQASHAVWNIIREADPATRRVDRLYWYVLDGGWPTALVDGLPRARLEAKPEVTYTYGLSASFAVFEMFRDFDRGEYVRAKAENPLVAMATADEDGLRLMVNNNTAEERTAVLEIANLPESLGGGACRIQRVDEGHSSDGKGLEEGEEAKWAVKEGATSVSLSLPAFGTVMVTMPAGKR